MKPENRESIIWIFCIIVMIILIGKISLDSVEFTCSECSVTLTNTIARGEDYEYGVYQIKELFEEYVNNGHCTIKWDPAQGYYNG